jgi:hypothetical protein
MNKSWMTHILAPIQGRAAQIITRAFRTTGAKAVEIEAYLLPLDQQIEKASLHAALGIVSSPPYRLIKSDWEGAKDNPLYYHTETLQKQSPRPRTPAPPHHHALVETASDHHRHHPRKRHSITPGYLYGGEHSLHLHGRQRDQWPCRICGRSPLAPTSPNSPIFHKCSCYRYREQRICSRTVGHLSNPPNPGTSPDCQ